MHICTTEIVDGIDGKKHYAIVRVGDSGSQIVGLFGLVDSRMPNEKEAKFFAMAPAMFDMLEHLAHEFSNINPKFPLSPGKIKELTTLTERAGNLVKSVKKREVAPVLADEDATQQKTGLDNAW